MASATWLCLHSFFYPHDWYILLSRVASLAHEAWTCRKGLPVHGTPTLAPNHRRSRLLLFVHHLRDRIGCCPRRRLLQSSLGLLCGAQNSTSQLRCFNGHACPANVRYQHHLLLQLEHLQRCWLYCRPSTVCVSWIWCNPSRLHHSDPISH